MNHRTHLSTAAFHRWLAEEPFLQAGRRYMSLDDAKLMGGWDPVDGWPRRASDFAGRRGADADLENAAELNDGLTEENQ